MIRIFLFLLIILGLGVGFAWFADRPGEVLLQWQGHEYQTSLMVVLASLVAIIASVMIIWWLGKTILDTPQIVQRFFKTRKKERGYKALTQGLMAANSGNARSARRFTKESVKLLGHEPLVDLLDAQALLLEGDREQAKARFEAMLEDDETRLVALRGLYLEAERQGAGEAARHYAKKAKDLEPSLNWAGNANLRYATIDGDWEGALRVLEDNKSAKLIEKDDYKRQKAVLLTALAMASEPGDPVRAAKLAREAHKLAPSLVPAAIIGAKALARNNDIGRAAGMIENVWKKEPHPDLATAYTHLRVGDSALDRLKRAKKLAGMKVNHREGNFAIAEAAIDAQDWKLARETMKPILTSSPSERACLIMAEVEESEYGDQGRMRDWLSRAVRAPKDAAWTADGYVSERWLPIAPHSGKLDAFEWKVPLEQIGALANPVLDSEGLEDLINEPVVKPSKASVATIGVGAATQEAVAQLDGVGDGEVLDDTKLAVPDGDQDIKPVFKEAETVKHTDKETGAGNIPEDNVKPDDVIENPSVVVESAEESNEGVEVVKSDPKADEQEEQKNDAFIQKAQSKTDDEEIDNPQTDETDLDIELERRPDDPGVANSDLEPKEKRFGIF